MLLCCCLPCLPVVTRECCDSVRCRNDNEKMAGEAPSTLYIMSFGFFCLSFSHCDRGGRSASVVLGFKVANRSRRRKGDNRVGPVPFPRSSYFVILAASCNLLT